ncbi:zinc-dependent alcohol dehydrogenase [Pseudomonas sp. CCC3.1]|uniref:zinc-dependent alcohol dehydrogenase n=1 Tax=Pseudomonas sp. CCC3.1 TaxID=3048607 RepID=UPI002AC97593|nr:alcohol dehydrogenase catalytic domain-containing protein [Pseudomonas sp. CCC3.1]MEB0206097.1 alcohol dehydrogenase catalytic domain-containing protein [Pseudomonas sp. CCC3.1]WPX38263.1 alcohol dehydrogenase catalytic domain-containing protein [Pseudomonas sp. CCC3.1]
MRAIVFKAMQQPLQLATLPAPTPRADEVLIEICRCGICGSDLHMTHDPAFAIAPNTVLGHEYSGRVIECGPQVSGLRVGDQVAVAPLRGCGQCASCRQGEPAWCSDFSLQGGGFAELATAKAHQCVVLPSSIGLADSALAEPLAVALHGVMRARLRPGAKVLILGAGAIGLAVAFWARRLGAAKVCITDLGDGQRERALHLGASAFLVNDSSLEKRIPESLGAPPDIVFECVGRPGLIAQAIEYVRPRGTIVILGLCTVADSFVPFKALSKEVNLVTSAFFNLDEFRAAINVLDSPQAVPLTLVSNTVSLAQMPQAFEALRQRTDQCKVMVAPQFS